MLVSTATDIPLDVGKHPRIHRRTGPLDGDSMAALVREKRVGAIVDATHPYATAAHATARQAADRMGVPCLRWVRAGGISEGEGITVADGHEEAARKAFSFGRPVLLTTGSRNLAPYVRESRRTGTPLAARVLPQPESLESCRAAGVAEGFIITGRGPFSVEENRAVIRKHGIGVLVTKDSGDAGGVADKLEAARAEGCQVVVVRRPAEPTEDTFDTPEGLFRAISDGLPRG